MLKQLLERLSLCGLNRMPVMPIRNILFGFILIPAIQVLFLIAGIVSIFLSDGWIYVVILFTQTILTIIAGIVLSNLRDAYLNRYYHSQFLEALHLDRGSNMAPVLREARNRGDRDTLWCIRLTPVPMVTTMIVNLVLILASTTA